MLHVFRFHQIDSHNRIEVVIVFIHWRRAWPLFVLASSVWTLTYRDDVSRTRVFARQLLQVGESNFQRRIAVLDACTVSRRFRPVKGAISLLLRCFPTAPLRSDGWPEGNRRQPTRMVTK